MISIKSSLDIPQHIQIAIKTLLATVTDKPLDVEVKIHREKRSLSQNSIAWRYINEIANILKKSKEEIYFQMLIDYGQSEIISVLSTIDISSYFDYYKEIGNGNINSKDFTHYKIYKGSSKYDKKEMSILIDGILQECRQLDIPTMTYADICLLKII